jgi:hypothetical protein
VEEPKGGPTLFCLVPETKPRREMGSVLAMVKTQRAELERMRSSEASLSAQLAAARETVQRQAEQIARLKQSMVSSSGGGGGGGEPDKMAIKSERGGGAPAAPPAAAAAATNAGKGARDSGGGGGGGGGETIGNRCCLWK